MRIFIYSALVLVLSACQGAKMTASELQQEPEIRHGFVFSAPKRTVVDVNDEASIGRGKLVFEKNCQSCHGAGGEGNGPVAVAIKSKPANLKKMSKQLPNHHFFMQINKGVGEMPSWTDVLTDREVWDLTNFIQSMGRGK
jgi:mono/diheme cytochrome c family protein